ncbi:hypothetical protein J6590_101829 [Homalodisca vitripennis]|nr:hypothetical protein J6590_101829 [Homalodisca vitripennis]
MLVGGFLLDENGSNMQALLYISFVLPAINTTRPRGCAVIAVRADVLISCWMDLTMFQCQPMCLEDCFLQQLLQGGYVEEVKAGRGVVPGGGGRHEPERVADVVTVVYARPLTAQLRLRYANFHVSRSYHH